MTTPGKPFRKILPLVLTIAGVSFPLLGQTESEGAVSASVGEDVAVVFEKERTASISDLPTPAEFTNSARTLSADGPSPLEREETGGQLMANAAPPLSSRSSSAGLGGSRHVSAFPLPWVEATGWESAIPSVESRFEARPFKLDSWDLFEGQIPYDEPPAFVDAPDSLPLFVVLPPRETKLARKLKRLGRRLVHKEIRRAAKKNIRGLFKDSASMPYALYRERMVQVNNIGREASAFDDLDFETTDEVKEDLFRKDYRYGERNLPLLSWGPLTVMDSGSMRFDLGTLFSSDEEGKEDLRRLEVGEQRKSPFLADKAYSVDTNFRLNVNPGRALRSGRLQDAVTSYGISVEVDVLSDILGREMLSTEFELEVDDHSEVAGFFNFVIKSRK